MTTKVRIPKKLFLDIVDDLSRPHPFAYERVGFITAKSSGQVIIAIDYTPVDDRFYIKDDSVGVRYQNAAASETMVRARAENLSILHVHCHDFETLGPPEFSHTDLKSLNETVPSFLGMNPKSPHGAILISPSGCSGLIWTSSVLGGAACDVVLVGFPLKCGV